MFKLKTSSKLGITVSFILFFIFEFTYPSSNENKIDILKNKLTIAKEIEKGELNNKLSILLNRDKNKNISLSYAKQALIYAKKHNQEKEKMVAFKNISYSYFRLFKYKLSISFIKKALNIAEKRANKIDILNILVQYRNIYSFYNYHLNLKKNRNLIIRIISLSKQLEDMEKLAKYTHYLGSVNFALYKTNLAYKYFEEAIALYEKNNNKKKVVQLSLYLGSLNSNSKKFNKAIKYFNDAKKIILENNFEKLACRYYHSFGMYYFKRGEFDKAIDEFMIGLNIAKKIKHLHWYPLLHLVICEVKIKQNDFDNAIECLKITEIINNKNIYTSKKSILIDIELYRGKSFLELNQYEKSLKHLSFGIGLAFEEGDDDALGELYLNLGVYYKKKDDLKRSVINLKKSLIFSEKAKNQNLILISQRLLSEIYFEIGNKKKYKYYKNKFQIGNQF